MGSNVGYGRLSTVLIGQYRQLGGASGLRFMGDA